MDATAERTAQPTHPTIAPGRLTPGLCRLVFAAVVALNAWLSWRFLTHNCPIDLTGDEAQYWTWSRHLAAGYYSKGPLVAYLIHVSFAALGQTMPAVRLPTLVLAAGTSCCTYWLTRKLFGSDRLALAAFLLGAIVPMFAAGGTLMTIDPPLFFCWAAATCLVAKAAFDGSRWAWPAAGAMAGLGVLAKYAMLLWPPLVLLWLAIDPAARRWLRSPWPWVMSAVALAFLTPPLVWNARHGWVTVAHVAAQTGAEHATHGNLLEFVGSQVAAVNPALCVFLVGAVVYVLKDWFGLRKAGFEVLPRTGSDANEPGASEYHRAGVADPHRRALRFLLTIGGGMWAICLLDSLVAKVQVNWPAPAYFTLLILTAHFIADCRRGDWKRWRGWFWGAVAFGLLASTLLHDATHLYPVAAWVDRRFPRSPGKDGQPRVWVSPKSFDLATKFRGIATPFATTIAADLHQLRPGAFVLCEDYMDASQLSFYLPGQPDTYFAGSYWTDPAVRRRWTQYDVWPDRQLDRPELKGKDAVYVGWPNYAPLRESFDKVTKLPDIVVRIAGLSVRTWAVYRCEGFHGMTRPAGPGPR